MSSSTKLPIWFWVIAIAALLWNLIGVSMYLGQAYITTEMMAALPENVQEAYINRPAWATAAFAIAVFSGLFGSILLLIKKKWAVPVYLMSLIAVLVQQIYNFFVQDFIPMAGSAIVTPLLVVIIAGLLYWYSKGARERAWLL